MKRLAALILVFLFLLSLPACHRPQEAPNASPTPTQSPASTPAPTPTPTPAPSSSPALSPTPTPTAAPVFSGEADDVPLPASSGEYSAALAMTALTLCTGHAKDTEKRVLEEAGFQVLKQVHYDKAPEDTSHTCAWTLGKKTVSFGGEDRTLLVAAIRGTNGGEWISNFDFAPSHDEDTQYAENFLLCAGDVLPELRKAVSREERPLLLICGHSRGAACANLLGVLLDRELGPEDIYVYTFATPTTLRGEALKEDYPNIFNLLNPCDAVTLVPPPSLGYGRAGQDILLSNSRETTQALQAAMAALEPLVPSITAYYGDRHSLEGPGLSDRGTTAFEFLCLLTTGLSGGGELPAVAPDSDFAPLMALLSGDGAGTAMAMQHMPVTYLALILASSKLS